MAKTDIFGHIRKPLPRLGGSQFYRDKRDRTAHAATFCGAPVTAQDIDARGARKAAREGWSVCQACLAIYESRKS